jgi:hypothetical protein
MGNRALIWDLFMFMGEKDPLMTYEKAFFTQSRAGEIPLID